MPATYSALSFLSKSPLTTTAFSFQRFGDHHHLAHIIPILETSKYQPHMTNISRLPRIPLDEPNWRVYRHLEFDDSACFQKGGRLIFFGDPHGCAAELRALILKVNYVKGRDIMVCVGDYVGKGPDSQGVLQLCIEYDIIGVLGNHDYTVLRMMDDASYREESLSRGCDKRSKFSYDDFGQTMLPECEDYLRRLPHAISFPNFKKTVVHAGFNYWRSITDQDVWEVMHMRFTAVVDNKGSPQLHVFDTFQPGSAQWASRFKGRVKNKEVHVVFGHDAKAMLQRCDFATGLDTGCCYGHKLTGLVCQSSRKEDDVIVEIQSTQPMLHAPSKADASKLEPETIGIGAECGMLRGIVALCTPETEDANIASAVVVAGLVSPGCGYTFIWNSIMGGTCPNEALGLQPVSEAGWSLFLLSALRAALRHWDAPAIREGCLGVVQDVFDAHDNDTSNGEVVLSDESLTALRRLCREAQAEGKKHVVLRYCSII